MYALGSAIQDDSDYHSFREQYESYRQDWILLDRMCSINTVQKKSSDILGSLDATLDQDQVDSTANCELMTDSDYNYLL